MASLASPSKLKLAAETLVTVPDWGRPRSNNSALLPPLPPAARTLPLASSVAVWPGRIGLRLLVLLHCRVAGLYSSALLSFPPAMRTWPLGSSVAVCRSRALERELAPLHAPVNGSYSSALLRVCPFGWPAISTLEPPVTRTQPLGNSVAVCKQQASL